MDAAFRLMQLSEYIKAARRTSITAALLAHLSEAGGPGRSSGEKRVIKRLSNIECGGKSSAAA